MAYRVAPTPSATYASTTTQSVVDPTVGQAITFNTIVSQQGITLPLTAGVGTKITLGELGQFLLTFSAVCHCTSGSNKSVYIWLRYNGNDVANSNSIVNIASGNEQIMSASFVLPSNAIGDYYELYMVGDTTACQIEALPAVVAPSTPVMPATPSIIVTINKIGL